MWLPYFFVFIGMFLYTLWQTPRAWWRPVGMRVFLGLFHLFGMGSLILLITGYHAIPNGAFRRSIALVETVYFSFLAFAMALCLVRQFGFYTIRHFRFRRLYALFDSKALFLTGAVVLTTLYVFVGTYNMNHLRRTIYHTEIVSEAPIPDIKIALISDLHVGAGATNAVLDEMAAQIRDIEPDCILIGGDVTDLQSSREDIAYLEKTLKTLSAPLGIYYVEGNHEKEAHYDCTASLRAAGVQILEDEAIRLENGVILTGRCDRLEKSVVEIRSASGLGGPEPCITLQHRPNHFLEMKEDCDLVLCGHTHGLQYPLISIIWPFFYDLCYGETSVGEMTAITTSGVSAWGYRAKWPAFSEVAEVNVHFTEPEVDA